MYSFIVKANQLVLAATLAGAIGAPYDVVAADKSVAQQDDAFGGSSYPLKVSCLLSAARPGGSIRRH